MSKQKVTATLVAEEGRPDFLYNLLGDSMVGVEMHIYDTMDKLCKWYNGGYWDFYTLSNGGGYMQLSKEGEFEVEGPLNYYKGTMSVEAASLVACAMGINHYMFSHPQNEKVADAWDRLMQFIYQHPEQGQILAALD